MIIWGHPACHVEPHLCQKAEVLDKSSRSGTAGEMAAPQLRSPEGRSMAQRMEMSKS